eukprot:scaffold1_cov402-Prasinococcus_capsulatus_cf.AAC.5
MTRRAILAAVQIKHMWTYINASNLKMAGGRVRVDEKLRTLCQDETIQRYHIASAISAHTRSLEQALGQQARSSTKGQKIVVRQLNHIDASRKLKKSKSAVKMEVGDVGDYDQIEVATGDAPQRVRNAIKGEDGKIQIRNLAVANPSLLGKTTNPKLSLPLELLRRKEQGRGKVASPTSASNPQGFYQDVEAAKRSKEEALVSRGNVKRILLTRDLVEDLDTLDTERFSSLVSGCFVRTKNTEGAAARYVLVRVLQVFEGDATYEIGCGRTKRRTNRILVGRDKSIDISSLSNSNEFEENEIMALQALTQAGIEPKLIEGDLVAKIDSLIEAKKSVQNTRVIERFNELIDRYQAPGEASLQKQAMARLDAFRKACDEPISLPMARIQLLSDIISIPGRNCDSASPRSNSSCHERAGFHHVGKEPQHDTTSKKRRLDREPGDNREGREQARSFSRNWTSKTRDNRYASREGRRLTDGANEDDDGHSEEGDWRTRTPRDRDSGRRVSLSRNGGQGGHGASRGLHDARHSHTPRREVDMGYGTRSRLTEEEQQVASPGRAWRGRNGHRRDRPADRMAPPPNHTSNDHSRTLHARNRNDQGQRRPSCDGSGAFLNLPPGFDKVKRTKTSEHSPAAMYHYKDPTGKTQGPFALRKLNFWWEWAVGTRFPPYGATQFPHNDASPA